MNIASRLESTGIPDCIHLSEDTYLLTAHLPEFGFVHRGATEV